MNYYAILSNKKDEGNRLYIESVYSGVKLHENDVFISKSTSLLPVYENLISNLNKTDWVWDGKSLVPSFSKIKTDKLTQLVMLGESIIKRGITIDNITLAALPEDQIAFNHLLVLLRTNEDLLSSEEEKTQFQQSNQSIVDIYNKIHTMTVTQLRQLIVNYGKEIQSLWLNKAQKTNQIVSATTLEELNSI